eukprot:14499200-Alexandrium_andersonii.AAC.1
MSASLVGSEMCIRDRFRSSGSTPVPGAFQKAPGSHAYPGELWSWCVGLSGARRAGRSPVNKSTT